MLIALLTIMFIYNMGTLLGLKTLFKGKEIKNLDIKLECEKFSKHENSPPSSYKYYRWKGSPLSFLLRTRYCIMTQKIYIPKNAKNNTFFWYIYLHETAHFIQVFKQHPASVFIERRGGFYVFYRMIFFPIMIIFSLMMEPSQIIFNMIFMFVLTMCSAYYARIKESFLALEVDANNRVLSFVSIDHPDRIKAFKKYKKLNEVNAFVAAFMELVGPVLLLSVIFAS